MPATQCRMAVNSCSQLAKNRSANATCAIISTASRDSSHSSASGTRDTVFHRKFCQKFSNRSSRPKMSAKEPDSDSPPFTASSSSTKVSLKCIRKLAKEQHSISSSRQSAFRRRESQRKKTVPKSHRLWQRHRTVARPPTDFLAHCATVLWVNQTCCYGLPQVPGNAPERQRTSFSSRTKFRLRHARYGRGRDCLPRHRRALARLSRHQCAAGHLRRRSHGGALSHHGRAAHGPRASARVGRNADRVGGRLRLARSRGLVDGRADFATVR